MGANQKTNTANNIINKTSASDDDLVQESNVIPFPIPNIRTMGVPPDSLPQHVKDYHYVLKHDLIEKWVTSIADYLHDEFLNEYSIPRVEVERFDSDNRFLENVIRAIFYRNFEMEHSLHAYMNTARKVKNEETGDEDYVFGEVEEEDTE